MGLDMYLSRRHKGANEEWPEEIAYWGKRWPVFHWFKEHLGGEIEDCKYYVVQAEVLLQLRDDCISVLQQATNGRDVTDRETAAKYLPISDHDVSNGYDEYYVGMVICTLNYVNEAVYYTDFNEDEIVFSASW